MYISRGRRRTDSQIPIRIFTLLSIFPAFTLPAIPASLASRDRLIVPVAVGAYRRDGREQVDDCRHQFVSLSSQVDHVGKARALPVRRNDDDDAVGRTYSWSRRRESRGRTETMET
jgi:hypothetical protein